MDSDSSLPARLIGHKYNVTLHYTIEYQIPVLAGPTDQDAVEEAELRRVADNVEPVGREIDAPSAPSENTFWDDSRHFDINE